MHRYLLASLCLFGTVAFAASSAYSQNIKLPSATGLPVPVIKGLGAANLQTQTREINHTYTVLIDCDEGDDTTSVYALNGQAGTYHENFCGDQFQGNLHFKSSDPVNTQGLTLFGYSYNGIDGAGEWGYFFGTDEYSGQYLVIMGEPFPPADPNDWSIYSYWLADRQ